MDILLFGLQGSGKGTMAKRLVAERGYYYFEAGGELRKLIKTGSELGKEIASYIDHGNLVPNEIMSNVLKTALEGVPASQKIIFDGIPRDDDQQRDLEEGMRRLGREFMCIELTIDEEEAIRRLLSRGKEEGRMDDQNDSSIRLRMSIFHHKTRPIIARYRAKGLVTNVDGMGSPDEVYPRFAAAIPR